MNCVSCSASNPLKLHRLLRLPQCDECHAISKKINERDCSCCGLFRETSNKCGKCDSNFCDSCISRNFGFNEVYRIRGLNIGWTCFLCDNQPILDMISRRKIDFSCAHVVKRKRPSLILDDISFGREKFPIPCFNEFDTEQFPADFVYVKTPVPAALVRICKDPSFFSCCSCTDNCRDSSKCECIRMMKGDAYDSNGILSFEKPEGIYECNSKCSCHISRCGNRVVGNGIHVELEVFRCSNPIKGWGVRCKKDIPIGSFIVDYVGEVLMEQECDRRGIDYGDEYLFSLDALGRSRACHQIEELGFKKSQQMYYRKITSEHEHEHPNVELASTSSETYLEKHLGAELSKRLTSRNYPYCLPVTSRKDFRSAKSIINDRVLTETDNKRDTYTIDAK